MDPAYPLLFRSLLARSATVYFSYHVAEKRVAYVSPAYEHVFNAPLAHVHDDVPTWLARLHPEDAPLLREHLTRVLAGEFVQDVEVRLTHAAEGEQWLSLSAGLELSPDGQQYVSGTVRDITRAKEASLNAQKFNTKKDATLEILSHDLATPLVLLQQLTEHLRGAVVSVSEPAEQLLQLMERTCTDGVNLIRDFVDNEFMASVNVELKRERADLIVWLRTLMAEYQQSTGHTHLQFEFLPAEQPVYVSMDINKFQQVINNLLSNAIKFTPDGGRIRVAVAREGERAVITVADTGVGIPAQFQPVLFDKFTKARRPGLRGEKTNGLGMSIIHTIVALHQGQIRFESQEGVGTTFRIEVPALPA